MFSCSVPYPFGDLITWNHHFRIFFFYCSNWKTKSSIPVTSSFRFFKESFKCTSDSSLYSIYTHTKIDRFFGSVYRVRFVRKWFWTLFSHIQFVFFCILFVVYNFCEFILKFSYDLLLTYIILVTWLCISIRYVVSSLFSMF